MHLVAAPRATPAMKVAGNPAFGLVSVRYDCYLWSLVVQSRTVQCCPVQQLTPRSSCIGTGRLQVQVQRTVFKKVEINLAFGARITPKHRFPVSRSTGNEMEKGEAEVEEGWQQSTLAAQAGFCQDGNATSITGRGKALWTSAGFQFESLQECENSSYAYRRFKGPNSDDLAHAVATLESAEAGLATSSGMGAVVAAVMGLLSAGDTVVTHLDTYGGTTEFFNVDARRFGIDVHFENVLDVNVLESTLSSLRGEPIKGLEVPPEKKKVMVFLESITNPIIREADVPAISAVAKKYGALLVVDHTFATPLRERPLLQGADLVVHSASKFLGGHNDLIAGVVVGPAAYVKKATRVAVGWGLCASAFDAWLTVRGIRTLQVRMERSWANAEKLVKKLTGNSLVLKVNSAPKCAVFSCEVHGGLEGVDRALSAMRLIKFTPTLGGVTTTLSHPAKTSHRNFAVVERRKAGIGDGLIRISVGLEDADELWDDLRQGLLAARCQADV